MKVFEEYNGVFSLFGVNYSNSVLQIRTGGELSKWLATNPEFLRLRIWEQGKLYDSLVRMLCPNEFVGLVTKYIYYDVHVSRDGEETYQYHEEGDSQDGYHGYLSETRYLDGSEDGTYWNCCEAVPFMYEEHASYENAVAQHKYFRETGELLY